MDYRTDYRRENSSDYRSGYRSDTRSNDFNNNYAREEPPLSELLGRLSDQAQHLIRQEFRLAQAEMTQKATRAGRNVAIAGVGAMFAMAAFYAVVAALILVLANYMDTWLAALLVGVALAVVGGLLIKYGVDQLRDIDPAPRQTIDSVRESKEWLTEQI